MIEPLISILFIFGEKMSFGRGGRDRERNFFAPPLNYCSQVNLHSFLYISINISLVKIWFSTMFLATSLPWESMLAENKKGVEVENKFSVEGGASNTWSNLKCILYHSIQNVI